MSERKLINEQDHSTFTRAFEKAARLPTEEDRRKAMDLAMRDVIARDMHLDALPEGLPQSTSPKVRNTSGWSNEVPISAPPGISLIDQMLPAESERKVEARKLLERLLRTAPNDPRVLAAQAAMEKEQKKAGNA